MLMDEIAREVQEAERKKKKIAMFHYQVLIHADELRGVDAIDFCREINVPTSYAIEYKKMLSLAELMRDQGMIIKKI